MVLRRFVFGGFGGYLSLVVAGLDGFVLRVVGFGFCGLAGLGFWISVLAEGCFCVLATTWVLGVLVFAVNCVCGWIGGLDLLVGLSGFVVLRLCGGD